LELGAGLGVCGILLDRFWNDPSATICITDGDTQALALLRQNIQRNNAYATCRQLLWGKETAKAFDQEPYQVIMASDIIYAPSVLVPLWETIQCLLDTQGVFVLAFAQRKVPVQLDDVLKTSKDFGFVHKCILQDSEQELFLYEFRRELEWIAPIRTTLGATVAFNSH
jgi:predicted nicotinamide N-methyase